MKNQITVYSYNPITFQYAGETIARRDPLEKEETFLIPANATDKLPIFEEGKITKFINNEWILEEIPLPPEPILPTLQEAKTAKITQLKANRNTYTAKSMDFTQAKEITFDEFGFDVISKKDFYFKFNVNAAGQPALEPNTIILSAQIEPDDTTYTRYSCSIIDGEITRKGYIMLNKTVATTLQKHIKQRATNAIKKSNDIEVLINACTTIEELNAINIEF